MKIEKLQAADFPKALLELPQPPETLWVLGDLPSQDLVHLCVVGSRKFTSYGREACEKIIAGLKGYPIVIVSGFAMGIDTIAHKAAHARRADHARLSRLRTFQRCHFSEINAHLMDEVLDAGGCFVSEFEPDFKATHWSFPMRNRLMAGISKAVLVIEAEEKSGTLITARLAVEYNKDVLAVPGSIFTPSSRGTNKLIRQGATPVQDAADVLEALGFEPEESEDKQARLFEDLSPEEKKVVALLREPMPRDEVLKALKMPIAAANALLSVMEIKELIKEELGELRLK
ncbi:MAG: DNA-processing protein DprA [bacterium]